MTGSRIAAALLLIAAFQALTVCTAHPVLAAVIYVNSSAGGLDDGYSWEDAFVDLQDALATAVAGDEIWVAEGLYSPTATGDRDATFVMRSGIGVYGGFVGDEVSREQRDWEAHETILSGAVGEPDVRGHGVGDDVYHVVTVENTDATAILDGFTIQDGNTDGFPHSTGGAGMRIVDADPIVRNTRIVSNLGYDHGGGAYIKGASQPHFEEVVVAYNHSDWAGGLYAEPDSYVYFTHVVFDHNHAWYAGGGAFAQGEFVDCRFDSNETDEGTSALIGGGYLEHVVFTHNRTWTTTGITSSTMQGGGTLIDVRFEANYVNYQSIVLEGSGTLANIVFIDNPGGRCGLQLTAPSTLTNAVFANTGGCLGAIYVGRDPLYDPSGPEFGAPVIVTNVTCVGNSGGALRSRGQPVQITNSVFWDNGPFCAYPVLEDGTIIVSHSLVQGCGGSGLAWDPSVGIDGGGNIDANPLFVDPGSGDYHLQPGSPAINTADSDALPPSITTDLDGNPRIVGNAIDMGAYEWQGIVPASSTSFGKLKGRYTPKKEQQ